MLNELSAVNAKFYGSAVDARNILDGTADLAPSAAVDKLHVALAGLGALWDK